MSVAIPTMVVTKLLFYYIMAVSIIEDGVKKLTTRNVTNKDGGIKTGSTET